MNGAMKGECNCAHSLSFDMFFFPFCFLPLPVSSPSPSSSAAEAESAAVATALSASSVAMMYSTCPLLNSRTVCKRLLRGSSAFSTADRILNWSRNSLTCARQTALRAAAGIVHLH